MRNFFHKLELRRFLVLLVFVLFTEGKKHFKHIKDHDVSSNQKKEIKSTFITIRIPEHSATHKKDCLYEGKLHRHGDAWSPGPCIPECRCKSGHVKCSKIECPDLNCERPTKRKWKCCPECSPETQDGYSCGVWTKGGNGNGGCCTFPFNYHGVNYFTCTYQDHDNPWCALTSDFDRDRIWGDCIDKGDSLKALRFKKKNGRKNTEEYPLETMENITNKAVLNAMKGIVEQQNASTPESGATKAAGNTTTPLPASSLVAPAIAPTNESTGIQPLAPKTPVLASTASNETMSANSVGIQPSGPILPLNASSIGVLPSPVPTPASSAVVPGQSTTAAVPAQFPFPVAGIPTQTSSTVAPIPAASPVASVPAQPPNTIAPAQAPFPVAGLPAQTAAPVAPIPAASPLAGVPAQPPNTVTPAQAPSPVAGVSAQSPMPVPSPVTGTSVPSRAPGAPAVVISQASNVVINPSPGASVAVGAPSQPPVVSGQPAAPGQQVVEKPPYPSITYPAGATPPLAPQPAPQTPQGAQPSQQPTIVKPGETQVPGQAPGQPNQQPFPISQTIISPEATQVPGQVPGQAVHEVTTTEINPNHNITTTESWLGKANETLNRTNEVANQTGNQTYDNDYQGNNYYYPTYENSSPTQAPYYTDQQGYSRQGDTYATDNSPGYDTASQQYWATLAQNTNGQEGYYSSEQEFQNAAEQGRSYYV
ncbi:uncharacterized protein [Montipora capricornis]|uniref:uncharacterized protein n=1 Tax=Montipora capricornis TaxID=246305 RepID=UPI0035F10163